MPSKDAQAPVRSRSVKHLPARNVRMPFCASDLSRTCPCDGSSVEMGMMAVSFRIRSCDSHGEAPCSRRTVCSKSAWNAERL
jgi:hypothetical protein